MINIETMIPGLDKITLDLESEKFYIFTFRSEDYSNEEINHIAAHIKRQMPLTTKVVFMTVSNQNPTILELSKAEKLQLIHELIDSL